MDENIKSDDNFSVFHEKGFLLLTGST